MSAAQAGTEIVAEPIVHQVDAEDREHQRDTRECRQPPGVLQVVTRVGSHWLRQNALTPGRPVGAGTTFSRGKLACVTTVTSEPRKRRTKQKGKGEGSVVQPPGRNLGRPHHVSGQGCPSQGEDQARGNLQAQGVARVARRGNRPEIG